ncbi:MAG: divergent polysaccharide deacetylase family protein [Rhodospirillales bacterium]|nr:divergent polysaccharide deacetylase family protein [Rhodospirillales bacterium]
MKFPKIFGKKKSDEDDEFDEDDFDIEEIEEEFDDELEEAMGSSRARETAEIEEAEDEDEFESEDRPAAAEPHHAGDEDEDGHDDDEIMVGGDDELENPFDDDDEFEDDDEFDDDDEYEDEASDKKKALVFAAAGFGVLLISILGGVGWWFFADSGPEPQATIPQSSPNSVAMAMPAAPGSLNAGGAGAGLNNLNDSAQQGTAAPTEKGAPTAAPEPASEPVPSTEQASGTTFAPSATEAEPAGSLNSLNTLNSLGGTSSLGGGLVVPAVANSAMAKIADQPTAADQSQALSGAPVRGMLEEKDGIGELPKISGNGAVSWQVYARPSDPGISEPKIALMIEGVGLSRQASLGAINKLPPEISMVLSPYGRELNDWVFRSRLAGHEVFISLPMESDHFPLEDAGPLALDTRIQLAENKRRLDQVMASAGGYVGLVTFMGSRFMKADTQMRQLFKTFNERGVMFVIGGNKTRNDAAPIAKELKLVHAESEMYIDDTPRIQQIRTNLDNLESLARDRGWVLAMARPYPVTIKSILDWYATIKDKGIVLVPASALAVQPGEG